MKKKIFLSFLLLTSALAKNLSPEKENFFLNYVEKKDNIFIQNLYDNIYFEKRYFLTNYYYKFLKLHVDKNTKLQEIKRELRKYFNKHKYLVLSIKVKKYIYRNYYKKKLNKDEITIVYNYLDYKNLKKYINEIEYDKNSKYFNPSLNKFKKEYRLTIPYSIYASYFILKNLNNFKSKITAINFLKQRFEIDKKLGYKINYKLYNCLLNLIKLKIQKKENYQDLKNFMLKYIYNEMKINI